MTERLKWVSYSVNSSFDKGNGWARRYTHPRIRHYQRGDRGITLGSSAIVVNAGDERSNLGLASLSLFY